MGLLSDLKCPSKELPIGGILPPVRRIIVIGDIHGDLDEFRKVLLLAKVINQNDDWIGKDTLAVQLGDILDSCRGDDCLKSSILDKPNDLKLLKYIIKLHEKALQHFGAIYCLMGNHEFMNVEGDMTYVSPKNYDEFEELLNDPSYSIYNFKDRYEARKWAFSPGNPIANFLACARYGALIIGSNLFIHGGLVPSFAKEFSPQKVNQVIRDWLTNKLKNPEDYNKIIKSKDYSPFWNRILGYLPENLDINDKQCNIAKEALDIWNVGQIHVGHTPQFVNNLGINSTCHNNDTGIPIVWRHDIGMSHAFDKYRKNTKKTQVLEILNDTKFNILVET